jgi:predicted ATPase
MRQMGFISTLHDLVVGGSQFIIATHSPIILAYPNAWIYSSGGSSYHATELARTRAPSGHKAVPRSSRARASYSDG